MRMRENGNTWQIFESRWANVAGSSVHTLVAEKLAPTGAPPLVVLSGFLVSSKHAATALVPLASVCNLYLPDLPGYGESDKPDHYLDVPDLADMLASWMEAMGLESAVMLGGSFGSQVVADFASRYPCSARAVILACPTLDSSALPILGYLGRWMRNWLREPPVSRNFLSDYHAAGAIRPLVQAYYAARDHIEEKLPHIRVPTLIVGGERDPIAPPRWCERLLHLLPNGSMTLLPGVAHSVVHRHPDLFANVVRPFIGGALLAEGR